MELLESDTLWDPLLALQKFPRYDSEYSASGRSDSPSPTHVSPTFSPSYEPRTPVDCVGVLPLILPPATMCLSRSSAARGEEQEGHLLADGGTRTSLGTIEEVEKETANGTVDTNGGSAGTSDAVNIGQNTEIERQMQKLDSSLHDSHRMPPVPEPSTYIFSPAFSTTGRKHTLLQRLFHRHDALEVPDEIVVGRTSSSGDFLTFNHHGLPKREGDMLCKDDVDTTRKEDSDDGDKDKEKEHEKEKEKDKEEVQEFIHLLHYPGSIHSDHVLPPPPQRTPSKAEQLIGKLFHLKSSMDEDRDKERGRGRDRNRESNPTSPQDQNGFFLPVSVDEKDIITKSSSTSPPQDRTISRGNSFTRARRSNSSSSRTAAPVGDDASSTTPGGLFKDLISTRHRRATSATSPQRGNVSDLSDNEAPNPTSGGATPTRQSSIKLSRSQSDASMAEKYGRVARNEVLGKGANATVRLAHKTTDSPNQSQPAEVLYAVKEFRKRRKDETQREYIKKVIAEFCISSNMHHENVIQTVDLIQDERDRWCEVMEYMPGGDLYTLLSSGTLTDPDEIHCFFKQLMNGVAYLHSVGVAHRDLKPENLLLDGDLRVLKITDFGVSEVFRTCFEKNPRKATGVHGSEPYIAPEEWSSVLYDSSKADIWACGIIFYTLLHTSIPWRVAKPPDPHFCKYQAFLKGRNRPNHGYPPFDRTAPGPRTALYRMLDPDPNERWAVNDVLEDEWFKGVEACKEGVPKHRHGAKD
ncbi:HAL protein kinase [Spizellomyces punctatus DAOM BR117]|uniref:non-specific serine/threonine protein kinase n=1 Tax=Spizellomyces punctatus (strain DAOM BR117) TaxID=645134 RepID=A0A0L0HG70_SPIPD|nr:HAL protein kinase [Spizellomyces punctatus DAOM BR117]KNC99808.1 HAL protein kinase [Spizellomyces punctatus DAOM BR117]|eukprot:XP_016607848.1 HAL protein kinase [Spizellomyces punctatus DAOM BR117]